MAKKGERKHMKRLSSPKKIFIKDRKKKGRRFLIKTSPGTHKREFSEPLAFFLREHTNIAKTMREVRYMLNNGLIKIDGKIRKKPDFPIGIMDILTVKDKNYIIGLDEKGRLSYSETINGEKKLEKVIRKTAIKNGEYQLTFHDGYNIITKDKNIRVGDSIVLDLKNKKIAKHIPLKEGVRCLVIEGKHSGQIARLKEIVEVGGKKEAVLQFKDRDVITRWNYLFALDEGGEEQ